MNSVAAFTVGNVAGNKALLLSQPAATRQHQSTGSSAAFMLVDDSESFTVDEIATSNHRRTLLRTMGSAVAITMALPISPAFAKGIKPDSAYAGLVKGREELITAAKTYFPKGDSEGLREFLNSDGAANINNYEANAQALLESKRLDNESKKEIGTIRRYGVGADVIIMYGGLKAEAEEERPNFGEMNKFLKRTLDSLDEVIAICRSNGFD